MYSINHAGTKGVALTLYHKKKNSDLFAIYYRITSADWSPHLNMKSAKSTTLNSLLSRKNYKGKKNIIYSIREI